jgi:hypothetical protein
VVLGRNRRLLQRLQCLCLHEPADAILATIEALTPKHLLDAPRSIGLTALQENKHDLFAQLLILLASLALMLLRVIVQAGLNGVVTTRKIAKGTVVWALDEDEDRVLTRDEIANRWPIYEALMKIGWMSKATRRLIIPRSRDLCFFEALKLGLPPSWLERGCHKAAMKDGTTSWRPNIAFRTDGADEIVATADILAGNELILAPGYNGLDQWTLRTELKDRTQKKFVKWLDKLQGRIATTEELFSG